MIPWTMSPCPTAGYSLCSHLHLEQFVDTHEIRGPRLSDWWQANNIWKMISDRITEEVSMAQRVAVDRNGEGLGTAGTLNILGKDKEWVHCLNAMLDHIQPLLVQESKEIVSVVMTLCLERE